MSIKTAVMLAERADISSPDEPVLLITARGRQSADKVTAWMTGEAGLDNDIMNAGMDLRFQLEAPGRGLAARAMLAAARIPDNTAVSILDTLRGEALGDQVPTHNPAVSVRRWAWDAVTAPGGMADTFSELGVPVGDPGLHNEEPLETQMRRHYAHAAAIWALHLLETLDDPHTTELLEGIVARRAARAAEKTRRPSRRDVALAGAAR